MRKKISERLSTKLLFESNRICNLCQQSGGGVQIHHIDGNHANNVEENLIVLCLHCHDEATKATGLTRSISPDLLRRYKLDWIQTVSSQRATRVKTTLNKLSRRSKRHEVEEQENPIDPVLLATIISAKREGYLTLKLSIVGAVRPFLDRGTTMDQRYAFSMLEDAFIDMLIEFSEVYPQHQFGANPKRYFQTIAGKLHDWGWRSNSWGLQGSIVPTIVAHTVVNFLESNLLDMIQTASDDSGYGDWIAKWNAIPLNEQ